MSVLNQCEEEGMKGLHYRTVRQNDGPEAPVRGVASFHTNLQRLLAGPQRFAPGRAAGRIAYSTIHGRKLWLARMGRPEHHSLPKTARSR
jgi:hypothetical protein